MSLIYWIDYCGVKSNHRDLDHLPRKVMNNLYTIAIVKIINQRRLKSFIIQRFPESRFSPTILGISGSCYESVIIAGSPNISDILPFSQILKISHRHAILTALMSSFVISPILSICPLIFRIPIKVTIG